MLIRTCCKPECNKPAEYEIWYGTQPDAYTDACLAHIGDLLTDAPEHRLFVIKQEPSNVD